MTTTAPSTTTEALGSTVDRLLVTVRDPESRAYRPVGFLVAAVDGFTFSYLRREVSRAGFRPLPGLARAVQGPVRSERLFPLFAERVISARRPDRQVSLDALGLGLDAAPFEVLVRSHGQRVGDSIELLPAPRVSPGERMSVTFLSHGVRYLGEASQERISTLVTGENLRLERRADNVHNPRALMMTDTDAVWLGWVPDPLISLVDEVRDRELVVEQANGPEVGFHFRLLVRLQGTTGPGLLFEGPEWATVG